MFSTKLRVLLAKERLRELQTADRRKAASQKSTLDSKSSLLRETIINVRLTSTLGTLNALSACTDFYHFMHITTTLFRKDFTQ